MKGQLAEALKSQEGLRQEIKGLVERQDTAAQEKLSLFGKLSGLETKYAQLKTTKPQLADPIGSKGHISVLDIVVLLPLAAFGLILGSVHFNQNGYQQIRRQDLSATGLIVGGLALAWALILAYRLAYRRRVKPPAAAKPPDAKTAAPKNANKS